MTKVIKYLLLLNLCLALATAAGSAWVARTAGSQAYVSGAMAMLVVSTAASLALVLTYIQSRSTVAGAQPDGGTAVSGVLLAMMIRMGLPILAVVFMTQIKSPLMETGFFGLLTLNYLVALPIETFLSLQFLRTPKHVEPS